MARRENTLEQKVARFSQKHSLVSSGETLVVAVSGGADSVCLLHIMAQLQKDLDLNLHVAHLNHQLRGAESDADARYVSRIARRLHIPAMIESRDISAYSRGKGCSIEEAARQVRYGFLAEAANSAGAAKVATGHTRDDHVETILLHLIRGTGMRGLRGIRPLSPMPYLEDKNQIQVIRPLLEATRKETVAYCQQHHLKPRDDSSNKMLHFQRNRARLELLPLLHSYNPAIDKALVRLATIAVDDVAFLEEQASEIWAEIASEKDKAIYLDRDKLTGLHRTLQRQIFRQATELLVGSLIDIESVHIEAMVDLLSRPAGKKLHLPHGLTLHMEYGRLALIQAAVPLQTLSNLESEFDINVPGKTNIPGWVIEADILKKAFGKRDNRFTARFDLGKSGTKLMVRGRRRGDRFQPLGMKHTRKLQDFMVDAKIPQAWRNQVPLVCSPQQILWVVGWRIDDNVKVTDSTRQVLRLKFKKTP